MCTDGTAGQSGIDARCRKQMCTIFHSASINLCNSLAFLARTHCSEFVGPEGLAALLGRRLIALDKNPGVRQIRIGDIPCHIVFSYQRGHPGSSRFSSVWGKYLE